MHDIQYTQFGQGKGAQRIPWATVQRKLGRAALVWETLRKAGRDGDTVRMPIHGIARRTGLTERQVKYQLHRLRKVGLIEDLGKDWRTMPKGRGYVDGWAYNRLVKGNLVCCRDFPYMLIVPRAIEKAVMAAGRGGRRPNAGRKPAIPNGWGSTDATNVTDGTDSFDSTPRSNEEAGSDRFGPKSKWSEPKSKRSEPPTESLGNRNQSCPPVKLSKTSTAQTVHKESSTEDAPLRPAPVVSLPRPYLHRFPKTPRPLGWDRLPLTDKHAAKHIVRLYSNYRRVMFGKPIWWRGSIENQKWWPKVLEAVAKMRELDVRPAAWIAWVGGALWNKDTPVPISIVFSASTIEKHHAWFDATSDEYLQPACSHTPPSFAELWRLWKLSQKTGAPPNTLTQPEYDRLLAAAEEEVVEIQEQLQAEVLGGAWVW